MKKVKVGRAAVGISDLLADRDCPRRAAYGARRHTGVGEQNHQLMTPEAGSHATEYGSCFHDCVEMLEDGWDAQDATLKAWETWGAHLGPADLLQLNDDLKAFEERRDFANVRTVMAETEIQLPLGVMTEDGREIWFRGRIDRLYERLDMPGHFIHVDYKGQPLTAQIMTPTGPRAMGDLRVGDRVLGRDGAATLVIGVFPLGRRQMFDVRFSDGTVIQTTDDHLWMTTSGQVMTTAQIQKNLRPGGVTGNAKTPRSIRIPRCEPLQFQPREVAVDPYLLGVVLGDGCTRRGNETSPRCEITTTDPEIVDFLKEADDVRVTATSPRKAGYKAQFTITLSAETSGALRDLGLWNKLSQQKFIPEQYLYGSVEQRRALLCGLMDTDGAVSRKTKEPNGPNQLIFSTTSPALVEGVRWLVESLGGTLGVHEKMGHVGTTSGGYDTHRAWVCTVQGVRDVFRLPRKRHAALAYTPKAARGRAIRSVSPSGFAEAQCIKVAAEDHLYVTEHAVVTHNTGAWGKTQEEVDEDLQLWSYNWAIVTHLREQGIEVVALDQCLDQLRHGPVWTSKTEDRRAEIKAWLATQAQVYFAEKPMGKDGLPTPRFNQWCPWCAIVSSCPIIPALTDWALSRIDFLAPADDLGLPEHTPMDEILDTYEDVALAVKTLKVHADNMKAVIRDMPAQDRDDLGFKVTQRTASVVDARGKKELRDVLGENWLLANATIPQARLKEIEDEELREWAMSQVVKVPGAVVVNARRK